MLKLGSNVSFLHQTRFCTHWRHATSSVTLVFVLFLCVACVVDPRPATGNRCRFSAIVGHGGALPNVRCCGKQDRKPKWHRWVQSERQRGSVAHVVLRHEVGAWTGAEGYAYSVCIGQRHTGKKQDVIARVFQINHLCRLCREMFIVASGRRG